MRGSFLPRLFVSLGFRGINYHEMLLYLSQSSQAMKLKLGNINNCFSPAHQKSLDCISIITKATKKGRVSFTLKFDQKRC